MNTDELETRTKAALAAWDCVHVVANIDVIADIPNTIEAAYREAPGIVRDLVAERGESEQVHAWGHQLAEAIETIRDKIELGVGREHRLILEDILTVIERLDK